MVVGLESLFLHRYKHFTKFALFIVSIPSLGLDQQCWDPPPPPNSRYKTDISMNGLYWSKRLPKLLQKDMFVAN